MATLIFPLPYYLYLSDSFVSAAIPGVEIELDANGDLRRSTVDLADDGQILLTVPGPNRAAGSTCTMSMVGSRPLPRQ